MKPSNLLILGGAFAVALVVACGTIDPGNGGDDAGEDAGTDAGSDAGTDAGTDGGHDGGFSCQGVTPPVTPLQLPVDCGAFDACGGAVAGRWIYDGGCMDSPFEAAKSVCTTATISQQAGTISGCVAFNALTVTRQVDWTVSGTMTFPLTCTGGNCAAMQTALQTLFPGSTCSASGTDCVCAATFSDTVDQAATYVRDGGTLVIEGVDYPYCVQGTDLRYREGDTARGQPEGHLGRR